MDNPIMRVGFRRGDQYIVFTVDLENAAVYMHLEIGEESGDFEFSLTDDDNGEG